MKLQGQWVIQGYFQSTGRDFFTGVVRDRLAERLQTRVRIANYPKGPKFRNIFFWRAGRRDYAEAQFFVQIAMEHPVLSAGVSVEKGLEDLSALRPGSSRSLLMRRGTWDWTRLIAHAHELLTTHVPHCAARLSRPVAVRLVATKHPVSRPVHKIRVCRTFVFANGTWFERFVGTAKVNVIVRHLHDLDRRKDWWVDAHVACDLTPDEVDGMDGEALMDLLWNFAPIRAALRRCNA